jgi:hypothetical protein
MVGAFVDESTDGRKESDSVEMSVAVQTTRLILQQVHAYRYYYR